MPWEGGGGGERFYFENEQACLLYSGGELHVIEYGINETVATLRTEHMSPYLLSVAIQVGFSGLRALLHLDACLRPSKRVTRTDPTVNRHPT